MRQSCKVPPWDTESLGQRHRQAAAVLASACACVAPSAYVADRYRAAFDGLPVQVIPHGIDLLALLRHAAPTAAPPAGAKLLTLVIISFAFILLPADITTVSSVYL